MLNVKEMKVVIVEDEFVAARNLERLIGTTDKSMKVISVLQSVEECVEWFSNHPAPNLEIGRAHV